MKEQSNMAQTSIQHPTIDETSKKIIEEKMADRKNKPTHERLYELNKERMQKQAEKVLTQQTKTIE